MQTEEGLMPVPIEGFCVVMIDGQVMLMAEENPRWLWQVARGYTELNPPFPTIASHYAIGSII